MPATKEELRNAFEAGRRSPGNDPHGQSFETYWEAIREERREERIERQRLKDILFKTLQDEIRRRNGIAQR